MLLTTSTICVCDTAFVSRCGISGGMDNVRVPPRTGCGDGAAVPPLSPVHTRPAVSAAMITYLMAYQTRLSIPTHPPPKRPPETSPRSRLSPIGDRRLNICRPKDQRPALRLGSHL